MGMNARAATHHITGNFNSAATITGGPADTYVFSGGVFTNSGTFTNAGALQSSDVISNSGTFTQTGPMSQSANFTNSGNATFGGTQSWSSGVIYTNSAGVTTFNSDVGSASASNLSLNISGGGVVMTSDQHFVQVTDNGSLTFQSSGNLSVSGPIMGNGSLSQTGTGMTTVNGNYTAAGPISISNGTLAFANTSNTRQDTGVVLKMSSLSVGPASTLDVTNHDLIIGNSNLTAVQTEILNGFNAGPGGAAITSSTALASGDEFLVAFDASLIGGVGGTWDNVTITDPNSIIVKYTYFGDVNLDGVVDSSDYALLDQNLGTGNSWITGDANLDGVVDSSDYAFLDQFVGSGVSFGTPLFATGVASPNAVVPEPASLFLLGLGSAGMLLKRKRRMM